MTTQYEYARPASRRSRGAVYYRMPSGEITWGGYDDALQHFTERGFQAMPKYGRISALLKDAEGKDYPDPAKVWGPILRHQDGPSEFTVSQIVTLRWYKDEDCPVPGTKFPQLRGIKVKEYPCPQCQRPPFISAEDEDGNAVIGSDGVTGLGNHLQIIHGWDRTDLTSYGERADIDFNRVGHATKVKEFGFDEPVQAATPEVESVQVEQVEAACKCGWKPKAEVKDKVASMRAHKNLQCPLTPEN
jgi:hypothetical protein